MKFLLYLVGILLSVIVLVYVVAFTPFGNGLVQPTLEAKIKEQVKLDAKVKVFALSMSTFELSLDLNQNNNIHIKGNYSLFSQAFNIAYKVSLEELKTLKPLTSQQLQGSLHTSGKVVGDMAFMKIDGKSDVGKSNTTYNVELTDLDPTSIIAKIDSAKLAELLYMTSQSPYASADINLDVNFKSIKEHALDGNILLRTKDGKINTTIMRDDFNLTIPKTAFAMNLDADLKGDDIKYNYELLSNLFKITTDGKVTPSPLKADVKYGVNIKDLSLLKPVTGADIRGSFKLNGTAKGTKEKLIVDAYSDVASSKTTVLAVLKDFAPASVKADIKNLNLKKLLYMVKQPHYTDGLFSLKADIKDARVDSLKGNVVTTIQQGLLDSRYMTKTYEFASPMPKTKYNYTTSSRIDGDIVKTKLDFNSNLANLDMKTIVFNIKDSSLKSDYLLNVLNLDKLFFVTQTHMRGGIVVNGDISKAKDLDVNVHTKVASGNIDAKLHNDDLVANLKNVQTKGLLYMLMYPELFKASLDAKVNYNLAQSKGIFDGHVKNGKFVRNQMFNLIKQYAHVDMNKETFNGDIGAKLNKELNIVSVDLRSNKSYIKTKDTKINTKKQTIYSELQVNANKHIIDAKIQGNINAPKVSVDLEKLMKSKVGKKVDKEINRFLKKLF